MTDYDRGLEIRRAVLGDDYVDAALARHYAGVPAANGAFVVAQEVLAEAGDNDAGT
jgi:alkylhydroperoxidase/carboxymuconolactone decarboxylase family protein YurZ